MKKSQFFYLIIAALLVAAVIKFSGKIAGAFETKPLLTPEEVENLLKMNNDQRAGFLHERKYEMTRDAEQKTLFFYFGYKDGWIKFAEYNLDFYWITFDKKNEYEVFKKQFENFETTKQNVAADCPFEQSNDVMNLCWRGYTIAGKGYQVGISVRE